MIRAASVVLVAWMMVLPAGAGEQKPDEPKVFTNKEVYAHGRAWLKLMHMDKTPTRAQHKAFETDVQRKLAKQPVHFTGIVRAVRTRRGRHIVEIVDYDRIKHKRKLVELGTIIVEHQTENEAALKLHAGDKATVRMHVTKTVVVRGSGFNTPYLLKLEGESIRTPWSD